MTSVRMPNRRGLSAVPGHQSANASTNGNYGFSPNKAASRNVSSPHIKRRENRCRYCQNVLPNKTQNVLPNKTTEVETPFIVTFQSDMDSPEGQEKYGRENRIVFKNKKQNSFLKTLYKIMPPTRDITNFLITATTLGLTVYVNLDLNQTKSKLNDVSSALYSAIGGVNTEYVNLRTVNETMGGIINGNAFYDVLGIDTDVTNLASLQSDIQAIVSGALDENVNTDRVNLYTIGQTLFPNSVINNSSGA